MEWVILGIIFWAACGVLNFGIMFAYFQREYTLIAVDSYKGDRLNAAVFSIAGPFGLIIAFVVLGIKHGLKFK